MDIFFRLITSLMLGYIIFIPISMLAAFGNQKTSDPIFVALFFAILFFVFPNIVDKYKNSTDDSKKVLLRSAELVKISLSLFFFVAIGIIVFYTFFTE